MFRIPQLMEEARAEEGLSGRHGGLEAAYDLSGDFEATFVYKGNAHMSPDTRFHLLSGDH